MIKCQVQSSHTHAFLSMAHLIRQIKRKHIWWSMTVWSFKYSTLCSTATRQSHLSGSGPVHRYTSVYILYITVALHRWLVGLFFLSL